MRGGGGPWGPAQTEAPRDPSPGARRLVRSATTTGWRWYPSRVLDFLFKTKRRERLRGTPLSPEQRAIVRQNVPYVATLSDADQRELEGHMQIFLAEKRFEGCGGLAMTEEIRLTIAAVKKTT